MAFLRVRIDICIDKIGKEQAENDYADKVVPLLKVGALFVKASKARWDLMRISEQNGLVWSGIPQSTLFFRSLPRYGKPHPLAKLPSRSPSSVGDW